MKSLAQQSMNRIVQPSMKQSVSQIMRSNVKQKRTLFRIRYFSPHSSRQLPRIILLLYNRNVRLSKNNAARRSLTPPMNWNARPSTTPSRRGCATWPTTRSAGPSRTPNMRVWPKRSVRRRTRRSLRPPRKNNAQQFMRGSARQPTDICNNAKMCPKHNVRKFPSKHQKLFPRSNAMRSRNKYLKRLIS